jgi:starch synthase
MVILMVASEVAPFAKTGGLADMLGSLSKKLEELGHNIRVALPYYRMVKDGNFEVNHLKETIKIEILDKMVEAEILTTRMGKDIVVYLIKNDDYYDREELYGSEKGDYEDNSERFIFLCKATLELLKVTGFKPDIIHCNDWQTGLIPAYLKTILKSDPPFSTIKTVFTIHNFAYQGLFKKQDMLLTGLPWEVFTPEGIEFYGKISFLKSGIIYGDMVTTVSKKYAQEIQTEEYGCGLEGALWSNKRCPSGILNGADYNNWNPAKDEFIIKNYGNSDLSGKNNCKKNIIKEFNLEVKNNAPLFGMVSRLVKQKGIDLFVDAADEILKLGNMVILGKGEEGYEKLVTGLKNKYPNKVGIKVGFDEPLAHKITAGCDFLLIPSRYEPCGLNAIYSLKYATIPIVRDVGGLDDIIIPFDLESGRGNGFKFHNFSKEAFLSPIREAIVVYEKEKLWKRLLNNALRSDYSWEKSAKEYEGLYLKALGKNFKLFKNMIN